MTANASPLPSRHPEGAGLRTPSQRAIPSMSAAGHVSRGGRALTLAGVVAMFPVRVRA
jgi:hypothetical protein